MAAKKASALRVFITGIVCVVMVGFGWLSDPLTAGDQAGALSGLLAWFCLAAAAIALIVAIYFTCRALTIHERQKESDLESEEDGSDESPGRDRFFAFLKRLSASKKPRSAGFRSVRLQVLKA